MTTQQPEALAADHSGDATEMVGRWYMVNKIGMATLCANKADAEKEAAEGFRDGDKAAVRELQPALEKALGQRRVLCDLLRECLPIIDAMLQTPGDDASDAHLQGLHWRVQDALVAVAEERLHECMA